MKSHGITDMSPADRFPGAVRTAGPVLVGVDGSAQSMSAVRWAAQDAALHRTPLHLVHAIGTGWDLGRLGVVGLRNQAYHDEGATALATAAHLAGQAEPNTLDVSIELVWPAPASVLAKKSRTARRLVVGSRGKDALDRALLGSVSGALIRRSGCPVVVVPAGEQFDRDRPVVVGVDGSAASVGALGIAFDEAAARDVEVVAVLATTAPDTGAVDTQMAEYAEKYPQARVRRIVAEDDLSRRLLQESEQAQLIVVGGRGRRGLAEFGLDSVSRTVLDHAAVPVVIARPHS